MKITLYTPDGTAETFRDCEITERSVDELRFRGIDYLDRLRDLYTTLSYTIDNAPTPPLVDRVSALLDQYETRGIQ